jgi:protein O-mannosyl-transferase
MASKKKYKKQLKQNPAETVTSKTPGAKSSVKKTVNSSLSVKTYTLSFIVLMLLAFLLYGTALKHEYALDDEMVITKNVFVQDGLKGMKDIFGYDSFYGNLRDENQLYLLPGGRYRPLSLATFAMEIHWFGAGKPSISHGINIFLYGLTAFLIFIVLWKLIPYLQNQQWYLSIPFIAAITWLVHPLHTEVVANIKGRDEILALFFSLAALWAAIKYTDDDKKRWWILSALFLFAGMLAKENAVTFIAVIPLSIWFFRQTTIRQLLKITSFFIAALVLFITIRYQALGFFFNHGRPVTDIMNDPFIGMSNAERYATTFYTLGLYIKLLFLPYPLTHDYYPYHVPVMQWTDGLSVLSFFMYLVMGAIALWQFKKKSITAYAILFFIITLSTASNLLFTVGTFMNERFLYMPSVAFALWLSWLLLQYLPQKIKSNTIVKWIGLSMLAVVMVFFSWKTIERVPDWKNGSTLNAAAIKASPNSARSNCFYAVSLYQDKYLKATDTALKHKLVDTMLYYLNRSVNILPGYSSALQMKIGVEGERYLRDRNVDTLYVQFENILTKIPYNKEARKFVTDYLKYLQGRYPDKTAAFSYRVGYELYHKKVKDYAMAVTILEEGLKNEPGNRKILEALREVYNASGNKEKAGQIELQLQ